ncbi:MAG: hypothetical protein D8M55_13405 [Chloroflexi bacterium]|nr:hypothetical protein [Chloroflexota bacterium]
MVVGQGKAVACLRLRPMKMRKNRLFFKQKRLKDNVMRAIIVIALISIYGSSVILNLCLVSMLVIAVNLAMDWKGGGYDQWDFLIDWKEGNLYVVQTVGAFSYLGTPTGMLGKIYAGTSVVHGVPGDVSDISGLLAGSQFDASAEIGLDAFAEVGFGKGFSVALDSEGNPYYTLGAGYMYTTANSLGFGPNAVPNAIELGGQLGGSESFIMWVIPLW